MANNEEFKVSEVIKKYRKSRNMTQDELATAAGICISTLKKYEGNERNPKPEQLQKIASALGVSINAFMPRETRDLSDIVSTLMQLDQDTKMSWNFVRDEKRHIIPETITISFKDKELNKLLAEYLSNKKGAKKDEAMERLMMYQKLNNEKNM